MLDERLRDAPWQRRCETGFTLAEILVVLVVIGLAAGLAFARLESDPRQTLEREARRLASSLEHAALLAQWRNETMGVSAAGNGYRFWRRSFRDGAEQWMAVSDDGALAAHTLPSILAVGPRDYAGQPVAGDTILPLRASGRNEPYSIEIASEQWRVVLIADPLNRVALSGPLPR